MSEDNKPNQGSAEGQDEPEVQIDNPSKTKLEESRPQTEEERQAEEGRVMAMLAYAIWPVPFFTEAKQNPFVMYHLRQGALILIAALAGMVVRIIGGFLPGFLGTAFICLTGLLALGILAFAIMGALNAYKGAKEPLPLIGDLADKVPI